MMHIRVLKAIRTSRVTGYAMLILLSFISMSMSSCGGNGSSYVYKSTEEDFIGTIYMELFNANNDGVKLDPWEEVGLKMPVVKNGEDAQMITAGIFEMLALKRGLNPQLFVSPLYNKKLKLVIRTDIEEIAREPCVDWARCFAFDWDLNRRWLKGRPVMINDESVILLGSRIVVNERVNICRVSSVKTKAFIIYRESTENSFVTIDVNGTDMSPKVILNGDDVFSWNGETGNKNGLDVWLR